jgi:HYR domain-containing protein
VPWERRRFTHLQEAVGSAAVRCLLPFLFCLGAGGCSFDSRGLGPPYWSCETELWDCPLVSVPPSVSLAGGADDLTQQVKNYLQQPNLWGIAKQAYRVYWDRDTYLFDLDDDRLKGSLLILTGASDPNLPPRPDFLRVGVKNDIQDLYVAYDSRANPPPSWLTSQGYVREADPASGVPYRLTLTMTDKLTGKPVELGIWRRKSVPKNGETVVLPTASYGNPGWGKVPAGNRAMYLVLVKPVERLDCAKGTKLPEPAKFFECDLDPNAIQAKALADCRDKQGSAHECQNTVCSKLLDYTKDGCPAYTVWGSMLKMQPESFVPSSEVGFSASKSTAIIEFKGKKYTRGISGDLLFAYQLDAYKTLRLMRVNALTLSLDPFDSEIGRIENIAIAMLLPTMAECTDKYPPWQLPCNGYRIRQGDFQCDEICTVEGKPVAFSSQNDRDLDVHVDSKARTMTLTGSTSGTATINDEDVGLKIQLTLVGDFLNFAPTAAPGVETTLEVDCSGERTNRDPVILDASSSFDIYDTMPATKAAYEWYEDYRLATEKFWGQGKTITIGKNKLGLGVHSMTLVVLDKNGIADTDTFDLTVRDKQPPNLVAPSDVHLLLPAGTGPVKVDLGDASVFDICSPDVSVHNDAPAGNLFSPGVTTVTWEAEDGSGNVTKKPQKVHYFTYKKHGSWADLAEARPFLEKSLADRAEALEECQAACPCEVALQPLADVLDQFAEAARGTERAEGLEAAAAAVKEAGSLLQRSNRPGSDSRTLRRAALTRLNTAQDLLGTALAP